MLLALVACSIEAPCADGYGRTGKVCVAIADADTSLDGEVTGSPSEPDEEPSQDPDDGLAIVDGELGLELERSEHMPTALTARWSAPEGASSWLEIEGYEGAFGEGRQDLVLLAPQDTELVVRAVAEQDGERLESDPAIVSTGTLDDPLELPTHTLDESASVTEGLVLFTYEVDDTRRVVLATGEGEVIWQLDDEALGGDSAPVSAQAALDGRGVFVGLWAGHAPALTTERMQDNAIWLYGWDGEPLLEVATPMAHHLFSQPAPGLLAWSGLNPVVQEGDTLPVAFERLVLSEVEGTDATFWDSAELGYQGSCQSGSYYQDACDAHHANSMDCDLETGTCLYSLHNVGSVLEVSSEGAELDFATWSVVDHAGDALVGFSRAHDVHWADDGSLLVFNDGTEGAWASRYAIDRQTETLTELWSYGRNDCIQSDALGTVQELPSGNHLVGFSSPNNLLREVTPDGQVVWELDLGGLDDGARCTSDGITAVLGEARMLDRDSLGAGVVAL